MPLKRKLVFVVAAIGLIAAWRLMAWVSMSGARKLADDLSSVSVFVGPAYPDPAGRQMLFLQNTESGVGVHTANMASGHKQLIFNVEEAFMRSGSVGVLGWSPDGSVFGYTIPVKSNRQHIVVCSGYVGQRIDYFRVDSQLASFAWLTADRFVYADQNQDIRVVARGRNRKWSERLKVSTRGTGPIENLYVQASGRVVWKQGNTVYRMNPAGTDAQAEVLWRGGPALRVDVAADRQRDVLLIGAATGRTDYTLVSLYAGPPRVTNFVHRFTNRHVVGLKSADGGQGYALTCVEPAGKMLLLGSSDKPADKPLLAGGNVQFVTPHARKLYIVGCTNVEPPGIWEYDFEKDTLRCVLPGSERGEALYGKFRHQARALDVAGRQLTYRLWTPEPGIFRQSFPVIIGQTPYAWTPYPYMAVYAGYSFVTIDRPSWHTDLDRWAEDVTAVLEELKSNPRLKTNDVYFYARSAETYYLSRMVAEKAGPWKGAMLFSPAGSMPDLTRCKFERMFVDAGAQDHDALTRLPPYQAKSAVQGVPLRLLIHETSRHTSWSRATQRTRLENLAEFLEDQ